MQAPQQQRNGTPDCCPGAVTHLILRRYHTGPGFFINSYLIFAAINATVWVYLLLALTNSVIVPCGPNLEDLCSTLTSATTFCCFLRNANVLVPCLEISHAMSCR